MTLWDGTRRIQASLLSLLLVGCVMQGETSFRRQFNEFFPDDPRYIHKMYRDAYLKVMADPSSHGNLGLASEGDRAALRGTLLRASREDSRLDGGNGEDYSNDLVFLLLRVGDRRFAQALSDLTPAEREAAALYLDGQISFRRDWFPLTAATYRYRWKR